MEMRTEKITRICVLLAALALVSVITWSLRFVSAIEIPWLRVLMICTVNLLCGAVAVAAMKVTGIEVDFDFKNFKQYLIGLGIALILSFLIAFLPAMCGFSLVGGHTEFRLANFLYQFFFFFLIVGPVEELFFRIYVQDTVTSLFQKHKWLGVLIAAALFGLWHIINGAPIQVLFTFGLGLLWGLARYFIKDLKYPGLALSHGAYDFLNVVVTTFVV